MYKKIGNISNSEMIIMKYIWQIGRPVIAAEIVENLLEDKKWSRKTVTTFLARLTEKGILKSTRTGRVFYYEPCLTEKEYLNFKTRQFIKDVHKGSTFGFISALCDSGDLTREDIEVLMKRLRE